MGQRVDLGRRRFLKAGAIAGGGLVLGFHLPACSRDSGAETVEPSRLEPKLFAPNAWLMITSDGTVTVKVASSEMGQGVMTAIPMLVAEELDADWSRVRAEFAPVSSAYVNPILRRQTTGGSSAVRGFWRIVREAGAAAREMLVAAAAQTWNAAPDACYTERGFVIHRGDGRRLGYGELAKTAACLTVPESVFLKDADEFRIIGTPRQRIDVPAKIDGSAVFGQDVRIPGLLVATVLRCPVFGGRLKGFDATAAMRVKGVRRVLAIDGGVAVVADGFWAARGGRDVLRVQWSEGSRRDLNSKGIRRRLEESAAGGSVARRQGNVLSVPEKGSRVLEAVYEVPYLAHACMEPMNCTAWVRETDCELWAPTQAQEGTRQTAARLTGLPPERIAVHTTFLGGGFGRRSEQDFVADAVQISKAVGGPVKVMWTREDDTRHDYYRPATYNRLVGTIDKGGLPVSWVHRIAGPSILARLRPQAVAGAIDPTSVEGAANLPYGIPHIGVSYARVDPGIPVGFWRSVGSSQNAFVTECFLDELAALGGRDPYQLRRALLQDRPRHRGVLELAAGKAGWGTAPAPGRARGIAVAESFSSFVAQVAEVSLEAGRVRVHRVVCAVDCGMVVNPDTVRAQMESGIVYGLSAALHGAITIDKGRVQQSNFHDYPILRLDEMPAIEVHILPSREDPGGVGEPGTPPIAPAVANAVFAATGRPVRGLPIKLETQPT